MSGARYITPEGRQRLLDEFNELWKVQRPKIVHEVSAAAAQGDRSENAEYIYGKKKLREIDRRLHFLRNRLEEVTVVDPKAEKRKQVFFGAKVTVEDEDGKTHRYQIIGPDEIDLKAGRISFDSPLGKALLGKKKGEAVMVHRPRGVVELTLLKIEYR